MKLSFIERTKQLYETMKTIEYVELPEFAGEFKRLKKKFKTLAEDFEMVKKAALELIHLKGINNQSSYEIPGLSGIIPAFKLKKFACQALKGKGAQSRIRLIYGWDAANLKIILIEIYHKSDKEKEDKSRIKALLKTYQLQHEN